MMEKHTLIHGAPLYGRRSGQILVQPFSFDEIGTMFPKKSFEDRLMMYSTVGGTITYLKNFSTWRSFWKTVEEAMLSKEQFLYEEVDFLLREEFREPRNYFSILLALSLGKRKVSEMLNYTGFDKATLSSYLSILQQLSIVKKDVPVTEMLPEKSRKGVYMISDHFFEFWFRFIFQNKSLVEEGRSGEVLRMIRKDIASLVAKNYEEVSIGWVRRTLFNKYRHVGRWWDPNTEIDIVGIDPEGKQILFGECKWSAKPVGTNVYLDLKKKATTVQWERGNRLERYIVFSKSGFTEGMLALAQEENVLLVHGDRLLG